MSAIVSLISHYNLLISSSFYDGDADLIFSSMMSTFLITLLTNILPAIFVLLILTEKKAFKYIVITCLTIIVILNIANLFSQIPNIIDPSVPIGKDDTENVEVEKFGEPVVPEYEIPYHADIISKLNGLDKEAAGRTSGNGFYYLMGDIARLHSAMITYARDYMIDAGFNMVSLATNHTLDRGSTAIVNSRKYWNSKDVVINDVLSCFTIENDYKEKEPLIYEIIK